MRLGYEPSAAAGTDASKTFEIEVDRCLALGLYNRREGFPHRARLLGGQVQPHRGEFEGVVRLDRDLLTPRSVDEGREEPDESPE